MEGILEVEEACKYLKMAKVTLYRHARNGVIPAFKVGGAWKFHKSSLDNWIHKRVKEDTAARSLKNSVKTASTVEKKPNENIPPLNRRKK